MALNASLFDVGVGLMREVSNGEESTFLSPVSIACALAMTYAGADGNTKAQMQKVIFPGLSDDKIHAEFAKIVEILNPTDAAYKLSTVNRIYAQQGFEMLDRYKTILDKHYKSELHAADFGNCEPVREEINSFVSEATHNKIKDLIAPGVLNSMTKLVLINAIYFKGDWLKQFEVNNTKPMSFFINDKTEKQVQMMFANKMKAHYTENEDMQMLGLPYKGKELMFVAILPKKKCGLQDLMPKLTGQKITELIDQLKPNDVNVYLPKFKLETEFSLNGALISMGVSDIFSHSADFSLINGKKDLFVSAVIHKAFIEVNEEGSEAAAATAVVMMLCSMPIDELPTPTFRADHPFLYFIVHNTNSHPLFIGRHAK